MRIALVAFESPAVYLSRIYSAGQENDEHDPGRHQEGSR